MIRRNRLVAWLIAGVLCGTALAAGQKLQYPAAPRVEQTDTYHGKQVADPYRWLEHDIRKNESAQDKKEADAVSQWIKAENALTMSYLAAIPQRDAIKKRLTSLWNFEKYTPPFKIGGRYYYSKNDGLQNQYVVYKMNSLDAEPSILFDPNTWSTDGTVALAGMAFSDDGRFVAYGIAEAGSDWQKWKIRDIAADKDLPDLVDWVKFSGASWMLDGSGFFYSRYDAPPEGARYQAVNEYQKLYFHRNGTAQDADVLVYHRADQPDWGFGGEVTEDGRYLIITISKGTADKYRIMYKDLTEPLTKDPVELISNFDAEYTFVGNDGPVFFFKSDLNAPKGRLIAIDTRNPDARNWKELIPQTKDTLQGVSLVGNMFITSYLKDVVTDVKLYDMTGKHVRDVAFPAIGTGAGFRGKRVDMETFYGFSSFAIPPTIYRYDMATGQSTLMRQAKVDMDPSTYETKQVFYTSKDGTRVPMFITNKKGIKLDGSNPTLLYGYGGFNISLTPGFSTSRLAWMEMGGVYAVPNLRGGGEYGEDWHQGGALLNKQNVFDDFIGAAEWLIANKYTSTPKLAIHGGSNGGLLVGACETQRPDLFGVCLPAVGVMDMLRFQIFTGGKYWRDDYGSSDDPSHSDQFNVLLAYSPYHNIKAGTRYPATMITTADTDDRVPPLHSFKFAASMQNAQAGDAPILIRIEERAGHGAGKPTSKQIDEIADMWSFCVKNLGMTLPPDFH